MNSFDLAWNQKMNEVFQSLKNLESTEKNIKLLDIGCGNFSYSNISYYSKYKKIIGYRNTVYGMDITNTLTKQVPFVLGDARAIPFKDKSFDIITCTEVIEHFTEGDSFIIEASRLLKKGGLIIITTPNNERITALHRRIKAKILKRYVRGEIEDHIREYSMDELCNILNKHGFNIIKKKYIAFNPVIHIKTKVPSFIYPFLFSYFTCRFTAWDFIVVGTKI